MYLRTPRSFSDKAAADLYGKNSREFKAVKEAWCAVGLCLNDIIDIIHDPHLSQPSSIQNYKVYADINQLFVECQPGCVINIHTPQGTTLTTRTATSEKEVFVINNTPFVLVSIDGETHKILLK